MSAELDRHTFTPLERIEKIEARLDALEFQKLVPALTPVGKVTHTGVFWHKNAMDRWPVGKTLYVKGVL